MSLSYGVLLGYRMNIKSMKNNYNVGNNKSDGDAKG